jgi:DNA (cytosine-5)-methyltransferase 1
MNPNKLKTGPWNLTDLKNVTKIGKSVFSCFHCGGGSTMGYKLAGFDVLGGVEIDPEMMAIYKSNHNPKHSYLMGVQQFKNIPNNELPKELFELDILDGSPPCSSFSMAGSREKAWGEKKKFREGQAHQVLDDLFFDFIDIAKKLQPKIVVAENVKGLIQGKAKGYVKQIYEGFQAAGYDVQLFLLNAAFMGVPQRRERTFFVARRKDLNLPLLILNFNEIPISIKKAWGEELSKEYGKDMRHSKNYTLFKKCLPGKSLSSVHPTGSLFNQYRLDESSTAPTVIASSQNGMFREKDMFHPNDLQFVRLQSFPDNFNFLKTGAGYVCGMSVPPFMMQRVATEISNQWLLKTL